MTGPVAPEIERGRLSPVGESLVQLFGDESLEDRPPEGVVSEIIRLPDSQEIAEEARVER